MTTSTHHIVRTALAVGITLTASCARAQAFDAVRLHAAPPGKDGGAIGAVVIAGTQYQGSEDRRTLVLPVLDYQWASGWFAGFTNGLGVNLSASPQMQYGLRITADLGRKEDSSNALRGMGNVKAKAEGGAFFNYPFAQGFALSSSLRYGSGQEGKGMVLDLGAGYSTPLASQWRLGAGTSLTMANADYLQSYFGVTAAQSASSGYAAYTPKAGIRDVRASASLIYAFDMRTRITSVVSVSSLLGDAKDSPLTTQATTASAVVAVSYAF